MGRPGLPTCFLCLFLGVGVGEWGGGEAGGVWCRLFCL